MDKNTSGDTEYLFGVYFQPVDKGRAAQNHCVAGSQREKQCLKRREREQRKISLTGP